MAKLKTIDAIRTSTQAVKKYVDNKKQDKLIYIEEVCQSHHIDINGESGDFMGGYARLTNTLNLKPNVNYTIKVKYSELVMPSSLNLLNKPNFLLDSAEEVTFELFEDKKYALYNLKTEVITDPDSGIDYTILGISYLDNDPLRLALSICDKMKINENDIPAYSEDTAVILLHSYYENIEYIEIVSSETETIKHEVSNSFLETHKFITEEERSRWNNKQDYVSDAYFIKTLPYVDKIVDRSTISGNANVDFIRTLKDGLYVATQDYLYFFDESQYVDNVDLFHGINEVRFTIAKNDIVRCIKSDYDETIEYCLIENLNTGISCMFDVDAGIVALRSTNETYLGDVKKIYEYECIEQGVTYTKAEHVTGTMNGGTSYREYQIDEDFVIEKDKIYHVRFVGSDGQVQEFVEKAYYDTELYGNPVYSVYANSISVRTYKSTNGSNIIKVKVYNSLDIPDMDSITINEVTYLSTEFLKENRFVTLKEKEAINNMSITQDEFDSIASDLFGFEKKVFVFEEYQSFDFPNKEPKDVNRIYCKIYYTDGSMEEKDMEYNKWGEGEKEYSFDLVVSPSWGTCGVYIDYQEYKQAWSIYMECGGVEYIWPDEIAKIEVIIEL